MLQLETGPSFRRPITEEQWRDEFWRLKEEAREHNQNIACYTLQADLFAYPLSFAAECLTTYLEENRTSELHPDLMVLPSLE